VVPGATVAPGAATHAYAAQIGSFGTGIEGRILFVKDANLWLWEGSAAHQLTQGETWHQARFSPDGSRIAYVFQSRYFSDIYTMSAAGGDFTRITTGQSSVLEENDWSFRPTWSPDGRAIAYTSDASSYNPTLWLMNADGRNKRPLAAAGGFRSAVDTISWSPDGRRVAVSAFSEDEAQLSQIYTLDVSTGARTQLTRATEGALDPAWSPDGGWIAFALRDGLRTTIQLMRADGTGMHLVADQSPARAPTWSPDGKRLAFLSAQGGAFEIWLVDVNLEDETPRVSSSRQLSQDLSVDAVSGLSWVR
jgi:Tol biopolymer transport system component